MLAYSETGDGPAIVLLHAFPLERTLWRDVTQPIADLGWRVITPDLPGFGASAAMPGSVDVMANAVAQLLNELNINSAVIGGCSMGGYVALAFAAQFPERTAALILVDTKANADGDEARANRTRIAEQVLEAGSTAALAVTQVDAMFAAQTKAERPDVVQWLKATIREQTPSAVASAQFAMAARAEQFEMLRTLHKPVLCIRGAEDALASADDHAKMAAAAGDGIDITVANAGHLVPIEQPAAFVDAVAPFLAHLRTSHC